MSKMAGSVYFGCADPGAQCPAPTEVQSGLGCRRRASYTRAFRHRSKSSTTSESQKPSLTHLSLVSRPLGRLSDPLRLLSGCVRVWRGVDGSNSAESQNGDCRAGLSPWRGQRTLLVTPPTSPFSSEPKQLDGVIMGRVLWQCLP